MKKYITCLLFCLSVAACGVIQPKNPICDTDQPSVLCEAAGYLSEMTGVKYTLDDVALGLKMANIASLSQDKYSGVEAFNFLEKCRFYINAHRGLTYGEFISKVIAHYTQLDPAVQALFMLTSDTYELDIEKLSDRPLTGYDYYMIILHIDKQEQLTMPFMIK